MIAALEHNIIPLVPSAIPEPNPETRHRTRQEQQEAFQRRHPSPPRPYIIDPITLLQSVTTPAEPVQRYDRDGVSVLMTPPAVGQVVDIYA